jgi:hypothetical protein
VAIFYPRRAGPAIVSLPICKRDPAPSVINGLSPLCEFRFRRGPDRRRWGLHHDVQFRRLTRVFAKIEKGSNFASESLPVTGDRGFESISLHERVACEPQDDSFGARYCRARVTGARRYH